MRVYPNYNKLLYCWLNQSQAPINSFALYPHLWKCKYLLEIYGSTFLRSGRIRIQSFETRSGRNRIQKFGSDPTGSGSGPGISLIFISLTLLWNAHECSKYFTVFTVSIEKLDLLKTAIKLSIVILNLLIYKVAIRTPSWWWGEINSNTITQKMPRGEIASPMSSCGQDANRSKASVMSIGGCGFKFRFLRAKFFPETIRYASVHSYRTWTSTKYSIFNRYAITHR